MVAELRFRLDHVLGGHLDWPAVLVEELELGVHPVRVVHRIAAAAALSINAADCVYVGDAERDITAGQAAGMKTLVARYGYLGADDSPDKWPADGWIDSLPGLLPWLPRAC